VGNEKGVRLEEKTTSKQKKGNKTRKLPSSSRQNSAYPMKNKYFDH